MKVTLLEPLGSGGYGTVYRAQMGEQIVAFKMLSSDLQQDQEAQVRFQREAEILLRLSHDHLVRALGMAESDLGDGLVLELADKNLLQHLQNGPLKWQEAAEAFLGLLDALHMLHDHDILHRDIKPHNILLFNTLFKLADLGIARVPKDWDPHEDVTVTGFQPGTLMFQSPEQVRGHNTLDARSDLYSMGVVLYNALTGRFYLDPSRYCSDLDLMLGILQDHPMPIPRDVDWPEELKVLLDRLLRKDPLERPRSALEVQGTLSSLLGLGNTPLPAVSLVPDPEAGTLTELIEKLKADYPHHLKKIISLPAVQPEHAGLDRPLPPVIEEGLKKLGILKLYQHQAHGINSIRGKLNTLLLTGTASGKTMTYMLPILEEMVENPQSRALCVYPVKALASDQLYAFERLAQACGVPATVGRYDGDTSKEDRRQMEVYPPQALMVNPDILHSTLLAGHAKWAPFWRNLKFIVLDEAHLYNGEFGTHVAYVLRRLQAVAKAYGADFQIIACSATMSDPLEHLRTLTGQDFTLIASDTSPRAQKHMLFWKPFGATLAYSEEWLHDAIMLMVRLLTAQQRVILFPPGRQQAEHIALKVQEKLLYYQMNPDLVSVYRGGLTPRERTELEARIKSGDIRGVVATNALEVGVDIGGLDAVILAGFPEEMSSMWQRVGRAGRRGQEAMVIFIPRPNRFDLYHLDHPKAYLNRPNEGSSLYPDTEPVQDLHLAAAIKEKSLQGYKSVPPFSKLDLLRTARPPRPQELFPQPHQKGIRGNSTQIKILEDEREVGTASWDQALRELHPEALYRHLGRVYRVMELTRKEAKVKREMTRNYTRADLQTYINIRNVIHVPLQLGPHPEHPGQLAGGKLDIRTVLTGYREYTATDRKIKTEMLSPLDDWQRTSGVWLELPSDLVDQLDSGYTPVPDQLPPSYQAAHAAEHLLAFSMVLITGCSPRDIQSLTFPQNVHPRIKGLVMFWWNTSELGVQLAEVLLRNPEQVIQQALNVVTSCKCHTFDGCPKCTIDSRCQTHNHDLWKAGARTVLEGLLGRFAGGTVQSS